MADKLAQWAAEALIHVNGNRHGPDTRPIPAADPATVLLAYTKALEEGDQQAAADVLRLLDPKQADALLSTFGHWRPYTDPKSGRPGFLSDAGIVRFADTTPATPQPADPTEPPVAKAVSQNSGQDGPPASDEVALAGKDGKALANLIRESKDHGVQTLHGLTLDALKRFKGGHLLFTPAEVQELAGAIAGVNSTADLLGRSRVREMADRATTHGSLATFADHSLSTFADGFPGILATPNDALAYFTGLFPTLSVDPQRWEGEQRRRAFTLAESANRALTRRVQELIADAMGRNIGVADATARIRDALSGAGVTPRNPQYAEMVFRTNAMDSFQTGMWEEGTADDVTDLFPVWQYLGIDDERAGADHRPMFDRYYPRVATFAAVRGNRPYNCRCSMRWVDQWEWADTEAAGGRAETRWAA